MVLGEGGCMCIFTCVYVNIDVSIYIYEKVAITNTETLILYTWH